MVWMFVLSLRNFEEPSDMRTWAPPGWRLLRPKTPGTLTALLDPVELLQLVVFGLGGTSMLPMVTVGSPMLQFSPSVVDLLPRLAVVLAALVHIWSHASRPLARTA